MKLSQKQNLLQIKQKQLDDLYFEKMKTNHLLQFYPKLDDYFKSWIDGSELVAVIPTLDENHPKHRAYYASCHQLSAVFLYENPSSFSGLEQPINSPRYFLFDSEYDQLFSYEKKEYSQQFHHVPQKGFETNIQKLNQKPFILFFYGCDDGHVGKRFPTKQDALEYLQCIQYFEEIFEDIDLQYHN